MTISSMYWLQMAVSGICQALIEFEDHFREYGTFCSSREKIKQLLAHDNGNKMRRFLGARNPDKLSSLNIESLFAKPMVVSGFLQCFCAYALPTFLCGVGRQIVSRVLYYTYSAYLGILFSLMLWWTILYLGVKREHILKVQVIRRWIVSLKVALLYTQMRWEPWQELPISLTKSRESVKRTAQSWTHSLRRTCRLRFGSNS